MSQNHLLRMPTSLWSLNNANNVVVIQAKPSCDQCVSTGRKCDGYDHVKKPKEAASRSDSSRGDSPAVSGSTCMIQRMSNPFQRSLEDMRLLDLYYTDCVHSIPGHFRSEVAEVLIPQLSQVEPTIHHAILAISRLYESTEAERRPLHDCSGDLAVPPTQMYAMQHYGKALSSLQQHMSSSVSSPVVALTACFLFVTLEGLRGRTEAAIAHIENGLSICKVLEEKSGVNGNDNASTARALSLLSGTFLKMSPLVNAIKEHTHPESKPIAPTIRDRFECPSAFEDLAATRTAFALLMVDVSQVTASVVSLDSDISGPDEAITDRIRLDVQIRRWTLALDRLIANSQYTPSPVHESSGTLVLRVFAKHATILLWASLLPPEEKLPRYTADFYELLDLVERSQVLELEEVQAKQSMRKNARPAVFIMDMGVNSALAFTVGRCAHLGLRLRALEILERSPRREVLWDSVSVARKARRELVGEGLLDAGGVES